MSLRLLIARGLLASMFLSSTFVINRYLGVSGGDWLWTGALRFIWVSIMLGLWFFLRDRRMLKRGILEFFRNWVWITAGTLWAIAYSIVCFSASYVPGWVTAAAWQTTIIATPIALACFGRRIPMKGFLLLFLLIAGVVLTQVGKAGEEQFSTVTITLGVAAILVAAFVWPVANQLVKECVAGSHGMIPPAPQGIAETSIGRVFLMSIGTLPIFLLAVLAFAPKMPTSDQYFGTMAIAVSSGVVGMSLFLWARQDAKTPLQTSAVDAMQSGQIIFSILGESIFFSGRWPDGWEIVGLLIVVLTIVLFTFSETRKMR